MKRAREEDEEDALSPWSEGSLQTSFFTPPLSLIAESSTLVKIYAKSGRYLTVIQTNHELKNFMAEAERLTYFAREPYEYNALFKSGVREGVLFLSSNTLPGIFDTNKKQIIVHSFPWIRRAKVKLSAIFITRKKEENETIYRVHYSLEQLMLEYNEMNSSICAW
jgi:hypothetical protein